MMKKKYLKIFKIKVVPCKILHRINRFVVKLVVGKEEINAHLTNTGRLYNILITDRECLAMKINSNKLKYRLISILDKNGYYSIIDTLTQNNSFAYGIKNNLIPKLRNCRLIMRNPKVNSSRLDFLYKCNNNNMLIETKSAVLRGENNEAMYPDCPTIRGRRHIIKMINLVNEGYITMLIFISAFHGAECFKPYNEGDPVITQLIKEADKKGVNISALSMFMDKQGNIYLENPDLPLCMD